MKNSTRATVVRLTKESATKATERIPIRQGFAPKMQIDLLVRSGRKISREEKALTGFTLTVMVTGYAIDDERTFLKVHPQRIAPPRHQCTADTTGINFSGGWLVVAAKGPASSKELAPKPSSGARLGQLSEPLRLEAHITRV